VLYKKDNSFSINRFLLERIASISKIKLFNHEIGLIISILLGGCVLIYMSNINIDTFIFNICLLIISLIFLLIIYLILDYFNVKRSVILIILIGTIIRIYYLVNTKYSDRSYDVEGHLNYIKYLFNNNSNIPSVNSCWECYQPPLYYLFSSIFYTIFSSTKISPIVSLQVISLIISVIVIISAYNIFKILFKNNIKLIILSLSLFTFWSGNIIFSIRISNDVFFYLFTTLSLLFLFKWIIKPDKNYELYLSATFAALDMISKANGIIMWGIIGLLVIIKILKDKKDVKSILVFGFLPILFVISILITFYNPIFRSSNDWFIGNISTLNSALRLNNTLQHFVVLDTSTYFTQANISTWLDSSGRQYFTNYLFKTSLFGEFSYNQNQVALMLVLSTLLLIIILIFSTSFFIYLIKSKKSRGDNFFLLIFLVFLASMVLLRFRYPYSSDNDFRFILPILIPFIIFISYLLNELEKGKNQFLLISIYVLNILFIALNIIFIMRIY